MLAFKAPNCAINRVSGITLIELMIVISLMMLIISLVGPLTLKMIDKAQAQTEYIRLQNKLKQLSYNAFTNAAEYELLFQGSHVKVLKNNKFLLESDYSYLTFNKQSISLNSRGYPYPEKLIVNLPNKQKQINIFRLIEGTDGKITP